MKTSKTEAGVPVVAAELPVMVVACTAGIEHMDPAAAAAAVAATAVE